MKIEEAITHTVNIYGSATETQAQGSSELHNSEITSVMRSKKKPLLALYSQPITIITDIKPYITASEQHCV